MDFSYTSPLLSLRTMNPKRFFRVIIMAYVAFTLVAVPIYTYYSFSGRNTHGRPGGRIGRVVGDADAMDEIDLLILQERLRGKYSLNNSAANSENPTQTVKLPPDLKQYIPPTQPPQKKPSGKAKRVKKKEPTPKPTTEAELQAEKEKLAAEKIEQQRVIDKYLQDQEKRCTKHWHNRTLPAGSKPLCDCVPKTLTGFTPVIQKFAPFNETLAENPGVQPGGHWQPQNCTARYKVVVIIPFRDRDYHLSVLLKYLHPILRGQQLDYTVIVVEQNQPETFNKASLMNIAFVYAREVIKPDCVIFHDVDIIPEDGRHFYTCRGVPVHMGAYHSRHEYRLIYGGIFGAVTSFRTETFEYINGFSNRFFGWGGEDDEMSNRLHERRVRFERDPRAVAGYTAIVHTRDTGNMQRNRSGMIKKAFKDRDVRHDGINSLRFVFEKRHLRPLYTWLLVNVMNDETKIGFYL